MTELGWRAARANRERGNHSCNALVVLDDGQRWIPQDAGRDDDNIGRLIQGHLRETGKYGLGWMIVAQSPTGIHNEVLRQSHTTYFGAASASAPTTSLSSTTWALTGTRHTNRLSCKAASSGWRPARQQHRHREFLPLVPSVR